MVVVSGLMMPSDEKAFFEEDFMDTLAVSPTPILTAACQNLWYLVCQSMLAISGQKMTEWDHSVPHDVGTAAKRRSQHLGMHKNAIANNTLLKIGFELAASLASSSSTPSERNGHTASATNQLIMHRYKAKSSQLQSPVSSKRTMANDVHCAQPGTSKDSSSGENGGANHEQPSTPKSGRKWKKTKAVKQSSSSTAGGASSGVGGPPSGVSVSSVSGTTSVAPAQSVLGVRLADCPTSGPDDLVPLCVQICVSVVEAHGLDTVGIYRIPGNTAAVNALKEMFSQGMDTMTLENHDWMFDDTSTADDSVPEQHPSETGSSAVEAPQYGVGVPSGVSAASFNDMHNLIRKANEEQAAAMMNEGKAGKNYRWIQVCIVGSSAVEAPQYGVGVPSGVSAASFNDMHNLIRKANEEQAAAMMNEGKAGKIKNILRRNSRRDKSKSKLKIESTAPAAMNPRPGARHRCGNHVASADIAVGGHVIKCSGTESFCRVEPGEYPGHESYGPCDPSPCARNASASPRQRPQVLGVLPEVRCQQKIRLRNKTIPRDPTRRHTLSDMDVLKEGRLEKFARWFGIRKSSPDINSQDMLEEEAPILRNPPPVIVRTSPNELTPASGDEQL
ncbi:RhoGAP domain protein [Teladorsagia circumcincta]|uniref:RhoGAP domain protein n=1 Tax=Teladorsagia circumcincta TaxID=45464 RepID=A0A2G9UXH7_TELCI|nr:RhoGAP domain protein [Teladorsagia circumcincta]